MNIVTVLKRLRMLCEAYIYIANIPYVIRTYYCQGFRYYMHVYDDIEY